MINEKTLNKPLTEKHKKVRQRLIDVAHGGETINYKQAFKGIMHHRDAKIGPFLGQISVAEHKAGRPLLSAVVIRKQTKIPGDGFYKVCRYLRSPGSKLPKKQCAALELGRVWEYWRKPNEADPAADQHH
jgi:hypothetical protein